MKLLTWLGRPTPTRSVRRRAARPLRRLERLEDRVTPDATLGFAFNLGSIERDDGFAITADSTGNIYVTGMFQGTVDFDPGPGDYLLTSNSNGEDLFAAKYTAGGSLVWARATGGTAVGGFSEGELGTDIAVDSAGNVIIVGRLLGSADIDPGPGVVLLTSVGDEDIFVWKLDADGNLIWGRSMGGTGRDSAFGVSIDSFGNVYTTGEFQRTVDFDPGAGVHNLVSATHETDIFVSKLDSSGNFVWAVRAGAGGGEEGRDLAVTSDGGVVVTGPFFDTVDFDPGAGTYDLVANPGGSGGDIFVWKLSGTGSLAWVRQLGGNDTDIAYGLAIDSVGSVYTTGTFFGTADFDPSGGAFLLTSDSASADIFVSKLTAAGDFDWAARLGGGGFDGASDIAIDGAGGIYTTGQFASTADFDPGPSVFNLTSSGTGDIFVSKLDSSGSFAGAWAMGGAGPSVDSESGIGITVDGRQNIYATGRFSNTADFEPGSGIYNLTSAGNNDAFVLKLILSNSPPVAHAGGPYSVLEGGALTLDASGSFDPDGDTLTYSWDLNGDLVFDDATGVAPSLSWPQLQSLGIDDGFATFNVTVRVDDGQGNVVDSMPTILTLFNAPPEATLAAPTSGVRGQTRSVSVTAADPSSADAAAGFEYRVLWGDGSPLEIVGRTPGNGTGVVVDHVFTVSGTYTIQVTAIDKDGSVSDPVSRTISIVAAQLQDDTLVVGGTSFDDHIHFAKHGSHGDIKVLINGNEQYVFSGVGRIVTFGQAGDDIIQVSGKISVPTELFGDDGDDRIDGGLGPNILDGGRGNDRLIGGDFRDFLIGGGGADWLRGNGGEDILLSDQFMSGSPFGPRQGAVRHAMDVWLQPTSYSSRSTVLEEFLTSRASSDSSVDRLSGGGGRDWFLASLSGTNHDILIDWDPTEKKNDLFSL